MEPEQRILSMDDLEHHKENLQPVSTGRKASTLAKIYSSTSTSTPESIESERLALETALESAISANTATVGDFHSYLLFLQQHYPAGHPDFRSYLETGVRLFKRDVACRDDPRILWMWMQVVRFASEPVAVFKYMSVNEIANGLAAYYIEYAALMVVMKRWEEADEIFRLGINRHAAPLDKLKQKYEDFKLLPRDDAPEEAKPSAGSVPSTRPGVFSNENDPVHRTTQRRPALASRTAPSSSRSAAPMQQPPIIPPPPQSSKGKMQIYQDRSEGEPGPALMARVLPSASSANEWSEFGTSTSRRKENIKETTRWSGATLPQKHQPAGTAGAAAGGAGGPRSRIEVYQDEPSGSDLHVPGLTGDVLREKDVSPSGSAATGDMLGGVDDDEAALRTRRRPESGASSTIHQPHQEQQQQESLPQTAPLAPQSKSKAPLQSRMRVCTELMQRDGKWVVSFEELRAAHILATATTVSPPPPTTPAPPVQETRSSSFTSKARAVASPTINTKAAFADVFEMFSQPLLASAAENEETTAAGGGLYVDEDETISAKVYRRDDKVEIGVFEDGESDNENPFVERPPLAQQQPRTTQNENETPQVVGSGPVKHPSPPTNARGLGLAGTSVRMNPAHQSTPYHRRHADYNDENAEYDGDQEHDLHDADNRGMYPPPSSNHNNNNNIANTHRRPLAIMTPITEVSHESDRTMALSTIGRSFVRNLHDDDDDDDERHAVDDGHTVMTMNTFGDRTLSSISYDGSSTHHTIEEDEYVPLGAASRFGGHGPAVVDGADVGIGKQSPAVPDGNRAHQRQTFQEAAFLAEGSSGVRIVSDDEEQHPLRSMPPPNPCDPHTSKIAEALMSAIDLTAVPDLFLHSCKTMAISTTFEKALRTAARKTGSGAIAETLVTLPERDSCPLKLVRRLGEGGFGKVYLVEKAWSEGAGAAMNDSDYDSDDSDGNLNGEQMVWAMKVQSAHSISASAWEYVLLRAVRERLAARAPRAVASIVQPTSCHVFRDESVQLLAHGRQGTLLDCLNAAGKFGYGSGLGGMVAGGSAPQAGVDEALAAFWTVKILRTLENVHSVGVIHRDVKIDNFLVRIELEDEWDAVYAPDGGGGWSSKGVTLIDWGTGIDKTAFPANQRFLATKMDNGGPAKPMKDDPSVESWEVRNGTPWTYEPDWYGAAGVIHVLLFGKYMEIVEDVRTSHASIHEEGDERRPPPPRIKLAGSFKRYWQVDIWKRLFEVLLNSGSVSAAAAAAREESRTTTSDLEKEFPAVAEIAEARRELERWLVESSSRAGKNLRGLLKRVATAAMGGYK
ncbi:hypothetical protein DFJ77DRAFT_435375 [Powellomyces hirtus]|nr:hypothetical protein DFJ77DRAFT_435375 [Powellomyces hirtus]